MGRSIRFRRRAVVSVIVTLGALLLIGKGIRVIQERITNAYAVLWVSDLVATHLERHNLEWPRDWGDLERAYEYRKADRGVPWSFQTLKERVAVDFDVNPRDFVLHPRPVIRLRNGRRTHWEHAEPNELIRTFLQTHLSHASAASKPAQFR